MAQSKEPVRLRKRTTPSGLISLYLDIYIDGNRTYEYLKMYLVPEKSRADKEKNRETMQLAEAIRAKRLVEVRNKKYGFESEYRLDTNFLDYYRSLCLERFNAVESRGNWGNWHSALQHLEDYCDPGMTFREVTPEFVKGFRHYLDKVATCKSGNHGDGTNWVKKPLSQNSKQSYFNKLRACINQAFEEKVIPHNPLRGIEGFKADEVERAYLTIEEVKAMAATECRYEILKRAFLFSCLTGVRKSDIEKMTWSEVQRQGEYTRIIFKQKKTRGQEYLDITPRAEVYMGERGEPEERVFSGFSYGQYMNIELKRWAQRAGVTKDITFHSGRHTFAVMMLDLGTDLYTVSKLLGHREVKTTQIYARVMDKNKQKAVGLIPDILGED